VVTVTGDAVGARGTKDVIVQGADTQDSSTVDAATT